MNKKIFACFMIFTLCFVNVHNVYADAGTLVVSGGTLGVAGLGGASLAGLAVPALAVIGAAMVAAGLSIELSEQAQARGMTRTEFIKSSVEKFCTATQRTAGDFYKAILSGVQITKQGAIQLSDQACSQISQLFNWLEANETVKEVSGSSDANGSVSISSYNFPVSSNMQIAYDSGGLLTVSTSEPVIFSSYISGYDIYQIVLWSKNPFNVNMNAVRNGTEQLNVSGSAGTFNSNYGTIYRYTYYWNIYGARSLTDVGIPALNMSQGALNDIFRVNDFVIEDSSQSPAIPDGWDGIITGNTEAIQQLKDVLETVTNNTTVIDPNIVVDLPTDIVTDIQDKIIDISDYLEIVADSIDGIQTDVITLTDVVTGVVEQVTVIEIDDNPVIEKVEDTDLVPDEDKDPVVDDEKEPTGDLSIDPFVMDLKGVFPFCIPYDFKDMLGLLNATPVAPSYTVNWHIPIINQNLTFTVDLSPYNDVASIMRTMELLAFCVALAVVTRSMFIRG